MANFMFPLFPYVQLIKTDNQKKDMTALWNRFLNEHVFREFWNPVSDDIYWVYTDYESDHTGYYTAVLGRKAGSLAQIPEGFMGTTFQAGKYSVYHLSGKCPQNVLSAWQNIWESSPERAYTADFDEYTPNAVNFEDSDVKIYLAV